MNDIPAHIVQEWFLPEAKKLKTYAPTYLSFFLKSKSLDINDFNIRALNTGETSACYFLVHPEKSSILKLKYTGVFAEAETLNAWYDQGVQTPKVLDVGVIEGQNGQSNIQFLQLEAVCNQNGETSPIGYEFIDSHLQYSSEIGRLMGKELAKMHIASSNHPFGSLQGNQRSIYSSWNEYLINLFDQYKGYLLYKGITEFNLRRLLEELSNTNLKERKTFIHGDFGIHNVLVSDNPDLKVYVIDPDPQIGDPYSDIASILFRLQISQIMYSSQPNNPEVAHQYIKFSSCYQSLLDTYFSTVQQQYDFKRGAIHKIITLLPKMANREKKLEMWIREKQGDTESYQIEINAYESYLANCLNEII